MFSTYYLHKFPTCQLYKSSVFLLRTFLLASFTCFLLVSYACLLVEIGPVGRLVLF